MHATHRPETTRRGYRRGLRTWTLVGAVLLGNACSTQVPHPLLEGDVEQRVTTVDLAMPPTVKAAPAAPTAASMPTSPDASPPAAAGSIDDDTDAESTPDAPDPKPSDISALQQQLDITVADVRSDAIGNNLEIKTELVRPSIAREDRREAEARFLPTAFARYNYAVVDEPGLRRVRQPNELDTDNAELGLQIPLQTGGTAQISMPLTRTRFDDPGSESLFDAAAALSLSQPLLRNAGRAVNLAPITVARLLERQQDANTKLAILNVLAGADRFYWNLYAAARTVEVRLEQYARAQEQERQATRLSAEGVVPAIEIVRARAGVARRVADIILAENTRRQVEREVKRAMNRADLQVTSSTVLTAISDPDPVEIVIDREAALVAAQQNRMELLGLELQLAVDSLTMDVTRNQKLPNLALDYSFRYLGAGFELNDTLDQIGRKSFANQTIGVVLEVPLNNQERQARYSRSVLQRALTAASREQQQQIIERQVLDAVDRLEGAWQQILAAREETLLAARNFQAEQRQFIAGVRTSTDVLIAADFLADAQVREVESLAGYEIAKIDIAFVTGTLLGSGQVKLMSFDETHDLDAVARLDTQALIAAPPARAGPAQESIATKLDSLGVKAPSSGASSGLPPLPTLPGTTVPVPTPAAPPPPAAIDPPSDASGAAAPDAVGPPGVTPTIGPVAAGDTLWSLAAKHRPTREVSVPQMMNALMRANPGQFPGEDPAQLSEGTTLRLPTDAELEAAAP